MSALEFCAASRRGASLGNDELSNLLDRGTFYRGMVDLQEHSLLEQIDAVLDKFSELRQSLLVIPVPIDISRGTLAEANQAWADLVVRLSKISDRGDISVHAVCAVGDDFVVMSVHPAPRLAAVVKGATAGGTAQSLLHLGSDVRYYGSSCADFPRMKESLLIKDDSDATSSSSPRIRVRKTIQETSSTSTDADFSPVSFSIVLVIELSSITSMANASFLLATEVNDFVAQVVELTTCATRELRKDEKMATITSMKHMVSTLEFTIQEERKRKGYVVRPAKLSLSVEALDRAPSIDREHVFRMALAGSISSQRDRKSLSRTTPLSQSATTPFLRAAFGDGDEDDGECVFFRRSGDDDCDDKLQLSLPERASLNVTRWSVALAAAEVAAAKSSPETSHFEINEEVREEKEDNKDNEESSKLVGIADLGADLRDAILHIATSPQRSNGSPNYEHLRAPLLSPSAIKQLLASQGSEDLAAYGLRAYQAIRDDILADVVSHLRDSVLSSPERLSVSFHSPSRTEAISSSPRARESLVGSTGQSFAKGMAEESSSYTLRFPSDPSERKISVQQSIAASHLYEAGEVSASTHPTRPRTAPAAFNYLETLIAKEDLVNRKSVLSTNGGGIDEDPPAALGNSEAESNRSSLSSLSSMGSPPRQGPPSPSMRDKSMSMSMFMSMEKPTLDQIADFRSSKSILNTRSHSIASPCSHEPKPNRKHSIASPSRFNISSQLASFDKVHTALSTPNISTSDMHQRRPATAASAASRDGNVFRFGNGQSAYYFDDASPVSSPSKVKSPAASFVHPLEQQESLVDGIEFYDENYGEESVGAHDTTGEDIRKEEKAAHNHRVRDTNDVGGNVEEEDVEDGGYAEEDERGGVLLGENVEEDVENGGYAEEDEGGGVLHDDDAEVDRRLDDEDEVDEDEVDYYAKFDRNEDWGDEKSVAEALPAELRVESPSARIKPDFLPQSVFTRSLVGSIGDKHLKEQLLASRSEIEASHQLKEKDSLGKHRTAAMHILRVLEEKKKIPAQHSPKKSVTRQEEDKEDMGHFCDTVVVSPKNKELTGVPVSGGLNDKSNACHEREVKQATRSPPPRKAIQEDSSSQPELHIFEQRKARVLLDAEMRAVVREAKKEEAKQRLPPPQNQSSNLRVRSMANKLSNQQQIKNALGNVCLAGVHFEVQRIEALNAIDYWHLGEGAEASKRGVVGVVDTSPTVAVSQFIILFFHSKSLSFRGLYAVDPYTGAIGKIFGRGPKALLISSVEEYYKYESSSRSFKKLPVKSLSSTVDAVSVDPAKLKKT